MENKQVGTPTIKTMRDLLSAILEGFKIETEINGVWTEWQGVQIDSTNQLDEPLTFKARIAVKKRYCNGVELDEPLIEKPQIRSSYFTPNPDNPKGYETHIWLGNVINKAHIEQGRAYPLAKSAIKHAKAMLKMNNTTARLKTWVDNNRNNLGDLDCDYERGYIDAVIDVSDILEGFYARN